MNVTNRARVREIFAEAGELPAAQRGHFLGQTCGSDANLRAEVESLLAAAERAGAFMAEPTSGAPTDTASDPSAALPQDSSGARVGPYKLLEQIGEGGFGSVYMAEQEQPIRRRVALKIIKLGMDTKQVVARFGAERQVLALMDHPNIARVIDAGATETGRPYFVMELVRGSPITQYCDEHGLSPRARLELFSTVCQAVQHAHQKGVIHRDIKPSNVLVTVGDYGPVPKVIDFGVAKAIAPSPLSGGTAGGLPAGPGAVRLTDKTVFTGLRQMIGTPTYMSPEQADLNAVDIDTRSDVYSLGVLLYELLTGTTPFDAETLRNATFDELRRIIREIAPPTPSTRMSSLITGGMKGTSNQGTKERPATDSSRSLDSLIPRSLAADIARRRATDPAMLRRMLHGDLDWIVMKCLEKDRTRRYETASALSADVQRHLEGEPVIAAPPSRLYRVSKTLRRHRTTATVVAALAVLIAGGLLAVSALWRQAANARDAESEQRGRTAAVSAFLAEMLTAADPAKSKGEEITVRELLDKAAKRIDDGALLDQPLVEASVRTTIGSTYLSLGLFPEAETQLRAADAHQTRALGKDHPDTLRTCTKLAEVLWYKSDYVGVADIAGPTLEAQRRILGEDDPDTLKSMVLLGRVLWVKPGKYFEAESLLRSAIERLERVRGHDHPDTAAAIDGLGEAYSFNGYPDKAEPLHREALRINTLTLGEEHPATLYSMFYLAHTLDARSAEAMHRRVYELRLRVLGPDHIDTLASQQSIAQSLNRQRRFSEAEPLLRESLAAHLKAAPDYVNTIHARHFLAWCLENQQEYPEAELLIRQALDAARKQFGPEDPDTSIRLMCKLAQLLANVNKDAEAEQVAREVLAIQHRQMPRPPFAELTQSSIALVKVLQRRGAVQEAMQVERELIDSCLTEAREPDASATTLNIAAQRLLLPEVKSLRDAPQALQLALQANQRSERQNPRFVRTLAQAYLFSGEVSQARKTFEEAVELLENDESRAAMLNDAAWNLLTVVPDGYRDSKAALEFSLQSNDLGRKENPMHLDTLALACFRLGDAENAAKWQRSALELLPPGATWRAECEARLAEYESALEDRDEGNSRQ